MARRKKGLIDVWVDASKEADKKRRREERAKSSRDRARTLERNRNERRRAKAMRDLEKEQKQREVTLRKIEREQTKAQKEHEKAQLANDAKRIANNYEEYMTALDGLCRYKTKLEDSEKTYDSLLTPRTYKKRSFSPKSFQNKTFTKKSFRNKPTEKKFSYKDFSATFGGKVSSFCSFIGFVYAVFTFWSLYNNKIYYSVSKVGLVDTMFFIEKAAVFTLAGVLYLFFCTKAFKWSSSLPFYPFYMLGKSSSKLKHDTEYKKAVETYVHQKEEFENAEELRENEVLKSNTQEKEKHQNIQKLNEKKHNENEAKLKELFDVNEAGRLNILTESRGGKTDAIEVILESLLPLDIHFSFDEEHVAFSVDDYSVGYQLLGADSVGLSIMFHDVEIIPEKIYALNTRETGLSKKVTSEKAIKTFYNEYMVRWCAKHAHEVFFALPNINQVVVEGFLPDIDEKGHDYNKLFLSVEFDRKTFKDIKWAKVDPLDSLDNFKHQFNRYGLKNKKTIESCLDPGSIVWATLEDEGVEIPYGLLSSETNMYFQDNPA